MKLFHLSDLHIGKQLHHYSLREDQMYILNQIITLTKKEKPQAVLFAGDIYDSSVPSAEAVELFDWFLTELRKVSDTMAICIIAGNHDSGKRLSYASEILTDNNIYIAGLPPMEQEEHLTKVTLEDVYGKVNIYLLPFAKPSHLRKIWGETKNSYHETVKYLLEREEIDTSERNVIVTHQFYVSSGEVPIQSDSEIRSVGGLEQVDVSILDTFDYAALGHIHRPQKMGRDEVRYSGTPLAYSVSEAQQEKSITAIELEEKGNVKLSFLPLLPLRHVRKLKGRLQEILDLAQGNMCEDYVSITLTDEIEAYEPRERLAELYQRILELKVENERTKRAMDFETIEVETLNPMTSFVQFFEEMNGRKMTEEEYALAEEICADCGIGGEL